MIMYGLGLNNWLKHYPLYFCGVTLALALSEPSFFSPAASVMANSCGCACELWTPDDGEPDVAFPLQCHCNMCGPVTADAEGGRCQVRLSHVLAFIASKDQGKPVPTTLEEMQNTIVFCEECREHNEELHREQRMRLAIQRMRAKVADAKRTRREQKRKYLRALFRTRFHGVDPNVFAGIAEFLL